jgi:hypothetical protein
MKRALITVLLIYILPQIVRTQTDSKFELQIGFAFSQFPTKDKNYSSSEIETINISPSISPLLGISKSWSIKNHLHLNAGLQVHKTGTKKYSLHQDLLGTQVEYYEIWEYLRMYKICIPIAIGYSFKGGSNKPLIYMGFRPNFIFSGGIDDKSHTHYRIDNRYAGIEDDYSETKTLLDPHKKLMNQYLIGFSSPIGKRIIIDLNYNIGNNYYETTYFFRGNHSTYTSTYKTSIPSSDFIISLHYKIFKH